MEKPIGYWLKRLDRLIENTFDRALAESGISRRQWQTLNTLHHTTRDDAGLREVLRPFWNTGQGDSETVADVVEALTGRGWIGRDAEGSYALTADGRAARASAASSVAEIRALVSRGVTEQEFQATMDVLRRMTANLESEARKAA